MNKGQAIRLATGTPVVVQGDLDELRPDLHTFFPGRARPDGVTPLPLVPDYQERPAPSRPHEVARPDTGVLKRRAGEMQRRGLSVRTIAEHLGVKTRTVYRWRAAAKGGPPEQSAGVAGHPPSQTHPEAHARGHAR